MAGILSERLRQVQICTGNPVSPSALQSGIVDRIDTYLFLMLCPTSIRRCLEQRIDCGRDLHKQLIEFGGAAKVWMTVQVEYDPENPLANKQPFEQYLSAAPTRIFSRDGTFTTSENLYIDSLKILTDRMREFNAKFIREKSGLRLARVLIFTF